VTWKEGLDIDQAIGEWGIVKDLEPFIREKQKY